MPHPERISNRLQNRRIFLSSPLMAHEVFPLPEITYPLKIDTLGKMLALGYHAWANCNAPFCNHNVPLNLVALAREFGPDNPEWDEEFKRTRYCTKCRKAGRGRWPVTLIISPCTDPHSDLHEWEKRRAGA